MILNKQKVAALLSHLAGARDVFVPARVDGVALVNDLYLVPVTVSSGQQQPVDDLDGRVKGAFKKLVLVDAMKVATEGAGNARTMNMVMAGALSAFCPFGEDAWLKAMEEMLSGPKAKLLEVNKKAFALGRSATK